MRYVRLAPDGERRQRERDRARCGDCRAREARDKAAKCDGDERLRCKGGDGAEENRTRPDAGGERAGAIEQLVSHELCEEDGDERGPEQRGGHACDRTAHRRGCFPVELRTSGIVTRRSGTIPRG